MSARPDRRGRSARGAVRTGACRLALALALLGVPGAVVAQQGSLQGIVTSSSTGAPLEEVTVVLERAGTPAYGTRTDRNGYYQVGQLPQVLADHRARRVQAGSRQQELAVQAAAQSEGGEPRCRIIGTAQITSASWAALANGTAAHALDFDDMCFVSLAHPSAPLVPALLAAGELVGAPGATILDAYVAGFEIETRLGALMNPRHYERGWHCTSTLGTIGAAAGVCRVLGLDDSVTASALAIAVALTIDPDALGASESEPAPEPKEPEPKATPKPLTKPAEPKPPEVPKPPPTKSQLHWGLGVGLTLESAWAPQMRPGGHALVVFGVGDRFRINLGTLYFPTREVEGVSFSAWMGQGSVSWNIAVLGVLRPFVALGYEAGAVAASGSGLSTKVEAQRPWQAFSAALGLRFETESFFLQLGGSFLVPLSRQRYLISDPFGNLTAVYENPRFGLKQETTLGVFL